MNCVALSFVSGARISRRDNSVVAVAVSEPCNHFLQCDRYVRGWGLQDGKKQNKSIPVSRNYEENRACLRNISCAFSRLIPKGCTLLDWCPVVPVARCLRRTACRDEQCTIGIPSGEYLVRLACERTGSLRIDHPRINIWFVCSVSDNRVIRFLCCCSCDKIKGCTENMS